MKIQKLAMTAVLAFVGVALLVSMLLLPQTGQVSAAPNAIPTPSAGVVMGRPESLSFNWMINQVVAADTGSTAFFAQDVEKCDIQWNIDIGPGLANTTTLKLQFSNDNFYWEDGASIEATVSADSGRSTTGGGNMQQFSVFGRWVRVYADVSNTNNVTPTVQGVCK